MNPMDHLSTMMLNIQTPASKTNDPESSYQAEDDMNKSGKRRAQQKETYRAVKKYPNLTSAELSFMTGLDRAMLARRLPELTPHIIKGESRICDVNDSLAVTWCVA